VIAKDAIAEDAIAEDAIAEDAIAEDAIAEDKAWRNGAPGWRAWGPICSAVAIQRDVGLPRASASPCHGTMGSSDLAWDK
jgi:hypothetical protein